MVRYMSKKKLEIRAECASIFRDAKWLCKIEIHGFSSRKAKENIKLLSEIQKLVAEYNGI
jgi:hypothetical protein